MCTSERGESGDKSLFDLFAKISVHLSNKTVPDIKLVAHN